MSRLTARSVVTTAGALALAAASFAWGRPSAAAQLQRTFVQAAALLPSGVITQGTPGASAPLHLELLLRPQHPQALAKLANEVNDPSSPLYHHFLKKGEAGKLFGASPSEVQAVRDALRSAGLTAGRLNPDGLSLPLSTTVSKVDTLMHARVEVVRSGSRKALVNTAPVSLPGSFGNYVMGVSGLDQISAWRPASIQSDSVQPAPQTTAPTSGDTTPSCSVNGTSTYPGPWTAYNIAPLYQAGDFGSGVTIGLYELAGWSSSDIQTFLTDCGLSTTVQEINVDGGASTGADSTEPVVDIEETALLDPEATIEVYTGPDSGNSPYDVLQTMVDQDSANVISISWGICESQANQGGELAAEATLYQQAATQGQSVFAASGDSGSSGCYDTTSPHVSTPAVDDPASQPYVTGVGGTTINSTQPLSESAWDGGGGGYSSYFSRPSWQTGPGVSETAYPNTMREVPDVSAAAGVQYLYCTTGCSGGWSGVGGTSVAAPFWAGVTALADNVCVANGKSMLGFLAPSLYPLAVSDPTALNDVTTGTNDLYGDGVYPAGTGYDMATGLGSPNVDQLVTDLCGSISTGGTSGSGGTSGTGSTSGTGGSGSTSGTGGTGTTSGTGGTGTTSGTGGTGTTSGTGSTGTTGGTGTTSGTGGTPAAPTILRLQGTNALGTSVAIANQEFPQPGSARAVVLARSGKFSDALAGGPLAAAEGGPLLLTPGGTATSVDSSVLSEITQLLPPGGTVYVLGGPLAISPSIVTQLTGLGYQVQRVAGENAAGTAVAIAEALGNPSTIFEATGTNFADALSAVPAAIETGGAILLTDGDVQDPATAAYLAKHPGDMRYAIGGPSAAAGADPSATPVYGQDRYGTSAAVAARFFPSATSVGIATGLDFPDALSGGVLMGSAAALGPVVLVPQSTPLPQSISTYMSNLQQTVTLQTFYVFGGPLAVSNNIVSAL